MINPLDQMFDICDGTFDVAELETTAISAGMVLCLDDDSNIRIFRNLEDDKDPLGVAAEDFDATSSDTKDKSLLAKWKISVYIGNAWMETDQYDKQQSYSPGNKLYAGTAADGVTYGQLTTAVPTYNKDIIGQVLQLHPGRGVLEYTMNI